MKTTLFNLYIKSLRHGRIKAGYVSKEHALIRLKAMSGEDFGYDIEQWKKWGEAQPEKIGNNDKNKIRRNSTSN